MANLTPSASWDAVIQLEGTMVGVPSTWNTPNQAMLNRTEWLKTFGVFKDGSGNVGIGTSTPLASLHVKKSGSNIARFGDDLGNNVALIIENDPSGAVIRFQQASNGLANKTLAFSAGDETRLFLDASAAVRPGSDNTQILGRSSFRWATIFAGTGTINTSDASLKTDIADLSAAELATAQAIKGLLKKFRFIDAVAAKGADARIHVGVIAQDVQAAFVSNGLDPNHYGLFCRDTWHEGDVTEQVAVPPEEGGEPTYVEVTRHHVSAEPFTGSQEVTRLGIRYEELLAFLIAAL